MSKSQDYHLKYRRKKKKTLKERASLNDTPQKESADTSDVTKEALVTRALNEEMKGVIAGTDTTLLPGGETRAQSEETLRETPPALIENNAQSDEVSDADTTRHDQAAPISQEVVLESDRRKTFLTPRHLKIGFFLAIAFMSVALGVLVWGWRTITAPVVFKDQAPEATIMVEEGDNARRIVLRMQQSGINVSDMAMRLAFRFHRGDVRGIHAGFYRFRAGTSPVGLVETLYAGALVDQSVRVPDGATIWDVRAIFAAAPHMKPVSATMTQAQLQTALGVPDYPSLEGLFSPDTYHYGSGASDLSVMRAAVAKQLAVLKDAWAHRAPDVALSTPYEALILASIIEKETGVASDRHLVSSVFHNRLRIQMPLQTDPTVVYGLGPSWQGRLKRKDLTTPTPYNTYTMRGLPPTPIAMPTSASIEAALNPAKTKYLYFVSRGDGTSEFSETLVAHNKAVNRFILQKSQAKAPAAPSKALSQKEKP